MVVEINAEKLSNKIQFIHDKIKILRKLIIEGNSEYLKSLQLTLYLMFP